eukprot:CAMPEP_0181039514 /NCGR_PEP_ID=MMETSP1070-20121207/10523_1 /TAXON_ID=265543 /ORGANISM="Minutocellus polymorphus, Strain NH13" /LENGTH=47 /DNA_ID= /DNA_START= /DNA_END= /DNA_ORIENTATION=
MRLPQSTQHVPTQDTRPGPITPASFRPPLFLARPSTDQTEADHRGHT